MKDQVATALQPLREIASLKPFADDFSQRSKEIYDSIARRAFEIFESSGRVSGRDRENWLKAEAELLHPVHLDIAESDEAVKVRAEVPGFSPKDVEIRLEPHRLAITGKRETLMRKSLPPCWRSSDEHRLCVIPRTGGGAARAGWAGAMP